MDYLFKKEEIQGSSRAPDNVADQSNAFTSAIADYSRAFAHNISAQSTSFVKNTTSAEEGGMRFQVEKFSVQKEMKNKQQSVIQENNLSPNLLQTRQRKMLCEPRTMCTDVCEDLLSQRTKHKQITGKLPPEKENETSKLFDIDLL